MKIAAVYHIKGGVGKTATSVNLASLAAASGYQTLLVDIDPQGASSFYLQQKAKLKGDSKKLLSVKKSVKGAIQKTPYKNLDILPANLHYRKIDFILKKMKKQHKWLKFFLKPVKNKYDFVFLDCPPNITLISENVFINADYIIVPVIPTTLSVRTYEQLLKFFKEEDLEPRKLLPFFSMYEKRKKMHKEYTKDFLSKYPQTIEVYVPYSSDVEKMGRYRAPVVNKLPYSEAAFAYKKLWKEFQKRIRP